MGSHGSPRENDPESELKVEDSLHYLVLEWSATARLDDLENDG